MKSVKTPLANNEVFIGYLFLLPSVFAVAALVLFPVLLNIWISSKQLELVDLRSAEPLIRQRHSFEDDKTTVTVSLRNASPAHTMENIHYSLTLPDAPLRAVQLELPDGDLQENGESITVRFDQWAPSYRNNLILEFEGRIPDVDLVESIEYKASNPLFTSPFTFDNYRKVVTDRNFVKSLLVTVLYPLFGAFFAVLFGLLAALLLRNNLFAKGWFHSLMLFPYITPIVAAAFIWVFLLDPTSGTLNALLKDLGLIERGIGFFTTERLELSIANFSIQYPIALSSVVFFDAWRYFPFIFLFILARLNAIPNEHFEASMVDGANSVQIFFRIVLPQLAGVLTTMFLLRFMWTFNKFDDIFLLTGGAAGTKTVPVEIYSYSFGEGNLGAGAAVAMVLFVFLAIFLIVYTQFTKKVEQ